MESLEVFDETFQRSNESRMHLFINCILADRVRNLRRSQAGQSANEGAYTAISKPLNTFTEVMVSCEIRVGDIWHKLTGYCDYVMSHTSPSSNPIPLESCLVVTEAKRLSSITTALAQLLAYMGKLKFLPSDSS